MGSSDLSFIFRWWLLLFVVGGVNIPLLWLFFKKFTDIGYGLSKTFGFLVVSYVVFLVSTLKILPLENLTLYIILAFFFILNLIILSKNYKKILASLRQNYKVMLFQEIFFSAGFLFWTQVKGYQPDINGLEKFMDYGFINSILRSEYLPPVDMWYTGKPINYYWFGHLVTAVVTKLSNVPSAITYNLMLATILGLTLTSSFSIVTTLVKNLGEKFGRKAIFAAGFISAIILTFGGNFHTPIYALKEGPKNYWYPDATRFIGYNPETNDKTIHEFPLYSFVVSDLHPHLLNLPFVLLYIALLANYVLNDSSVNSKFEARSTKQYQNSKLKFPKRFGILKFNNWNLFRISDLEFRILPLGFLLGIFFMTNTWDFGNYFLTTGGVFLLFNLKKRGLTLDAFFKTGISLITIFALGLLTALPFIFNFESIAQGIALVRARTPVWQLAVLWGFPAILTSIFAALINKTRKIEASDLFVVALLIASWALIFLPEIIYVKDIYIASHHRANTMFKLTYQAYVMFYLLSGYIAVRTLTLTKKLVKASLLLLYSFVFVSVLWYPNFAIKSYYGNLKEYKGLSGETWLSQRHTDTYGVVLWFRENVSGQPTILEAPGDSYTEFNVISAYTGLPTVSGWFVHEWLWRGSSEIPQARVSDISEIYTSSDLQETKNLLSRYRVEYVIVGEFERQKYPNLNEEKFKQAATLVFTSGTTSIYQIINPPFN